MPQAENPSAEPEIPLVVVNRGTFDEALPVAAVTRHRARDMSLAATYERLASSKALYKVLAATATGAALIACYTFLLTTEGVTTSPPALIAVLVAATLSSIAGFAFSAICGVLLLHMMNNPVQVVEIMMVCSIAIQSLSVAVLWHDMEWDKLAVFLIGGVVGLPLGIGMLLHLGSAGFREVIGGLLTAYAAYVLLKRPITITAGGSAADIGIGFLGGITGGLAGFPGATVTIWCSMKGWDKRRQRGLYQPFILVMQIMALGAIEVMQPTKSLSHALDLGPLQFVPPALLGTLFGLSIFKGMSDRIFTLTVNVLLLGSGIGLLM